MCTEPLFFFFKVMIHSAHTFSCLTLTIAFYASALKLYNVNELSRVRATQPHSQIFCNRKAVLCLAVKIRLLRGSASGGAEPISRCPPTHLLTTYDLTLVVNSSLKPTLTVYQRYDYNIQMIN